MKINGAALAIGGGGLVALYFLLKPSAAKAATVPKAAKPSSLPAVQARGDNNYVLANTDSNNFGVPDVTQYTPPANANNPNPGGTDGSSAGAAYSAPDLTSYTP